jgi:hypothetical protein
VTSEQLLASLEGLGFKEFVNNFDEFLSSDPILLYNSVTATWEQQMELE